MQEESIGLLTKYWDDAMNKENYYKLEGYQQGISDGKITRGKINNKYVKNLLKLGLNTFNLSMSNIVFYRIKRKGKDIINKSSKIIHDQGVLSFTVWAVKSFSRRIFVRNCATWYCVPLNQQTNTVKLEPKKEISVTFDRIDEVLLWLKNQHRDYGWMYVAKELELIDSEKHIIATVRKENEIIGYIKIGKGKVYISDFDSIIPLSDSTALIYDTFILPQHRGRGFASSLLFEVVNNFRGSKINCVWCHIPDNNKASQKVYMKNGFCKVAHVKFVRILSLRFYSKNITQMLNRGGDFLSLNLTSNYKNRNFSHDLASSSKNLSFSKI